MPAVYSKITISTHISAKALPQIALDALESSPRNANIMLPSVQKGILRERKPAEVEAWIVCYSSDSPGSVDFILSCVEGLLGSYPIFIFTPHPFCRLDEDFLSLRIPRLVQALHASVPTHRVYSIFAPEPVASFFASLWSEYFRIPLNPNPFYYAAKLTFCSHRTFKNRQMTLHPDLIYEIRPAVENDIMEAAVLCRGFASGSVSH
jgi:hypothetical protein